MSAYPDGKKVGTSVALAYVGAVVPDQPAFHTDAFSRAGNMFQENLLVAMKDAGLPASLILSQRPLRAFPNSRTICAAHSRVHLNGLTISLLPFLNLPFIRPLTVGLVVLVSLLFWGWHQRKSNRVVLTFNLTEPSGLFTLVGSRLIGAKAIAAVTDINVPGQTVSATLARRLDFWLQRRLIPRFDGLIVVTKRIIEDFAPDKPFVRIEGGVNGAVLQRFDAHPGKFTGGSPFTIVAAGSLDEANGFIELLEAFSLLPGDNYCLRIAGAGPLEGMIRRAAEEDVRIQYCGYLPLDEVLALYQTADVLVNMRVTQRIKTDYFFPSKLIEYLASGIPVITTCTGHVEEEYAEIAFLLKDETPEALARIIEHVASMDPRLRAQKGQAAREYIRTRNTWEAQGHRVVEFIRSEVLH